MNRLALPFSRVTGQFRSFFTPRTSRFVTFSISKPRSFANIAMSSAMLKNIKDNLSQDSCTSVLLDWSIKADQFEPEAQELKEYSIKVFDSVAAASENASWASVCQPLCDLSTLFSLADSSLTFPQHVSADKEIREASTKAESILQEVMTEQWSRHDVYLAFKALAAKEEGKPTLQGEQKRYFERALRDFKRKGLDLEKDVRDKVLDMNKECNNLGIEFSKNLGEENTKLYFTREELPGVPEDFIEGLEKKDDKFELTLSYPHVLPVLKMCSHVPTRMAMEKAFNSRCAGTNDRILERLVTLRDDTAKLLGYKDHASFVTEIRMAKTPEAVMAFLDDLDEKLTPLQDTEMQAMVALKNEEEGDKSDGIIHAYDFSYYRNKVEKTQYQVDHEAIKQYFPLEKVTSGLLGIYEELLGLQMELVEDAAVWHPEAKMYKVSNSSDGKLVGFFYIDLHPREGKYGHAACWGLQPSVALSNGRLVPVAALVCNFPKGTKDKPALLPHGDVETFFHEFGHGMHQLCSLAELPSFAGTRVERDFVELPSQMLENWCWEAAALKRMSGRLEDGAPLPDELIETMKKSRQANAGVNNKRQVLFAKFDQHIHKQQKVDVAQVFAEFAKDIQKIEVTPDTSFPASFGHLAGGYDASYYGYLYSEVFAMDCFEVKFQDNIFSAEAGKQYRDKILGPGGSIDGLDMLRNFLGRDPKPDAFLRSKGLSN